MIELVNVGAIITEVVSISGITSVSSLRRGRLKQDTKIARYDSSTQLCQIITILD